MKKKGGDKRVQTDKKSEIKKRPGAWQGLGVSVFFGGCPHRGGRSPLRKNIYRLQFLTSAASVFKPLLFRCNFNATDFF